MSSRIQDIKILASNYALPPTLLGFSPNYAALFQFQLDECLAEYPQRSSEQV